MQSNARQRKLLLKCFIWRKCDKPGTVIVLFLNRKYMQPQKTSAELSNWLEPILEIWSYKKWSLSLLCCLDHTSKAEKKANMQPSSRITISGTSRCMSTVGLSFQVMPLSAPLSVTEMQALFVGGWDVFPDLSELSPALECLCLPCPGSVSPLADAWYGLTKLSWFTWSQLTENGKDWCHLGWLELLALFQLFYLVTVWVVNFLWAGEKWKACFSLAWDTSMLRNEETAVLTLWWRSKHTKNPQTLLFREASPQLSYLGATMWWAGRSDGKLAVLC